jgi:subtilisin-like proprotein convertase family protein
MKMPIVILCLLALPLPGSMQEKGANQKNEPVKSPRLWALRTTHGAEQPRFEGASARPLRGFKDYFILDFSRGNLADQAIEELIAQHPDILWSEKQEENLIAKTTDVPIPFPYENPGVRESWHLINSGQSKGRKGEDLNILPVWDSGISGNGVLVAIVDEGIELNHPDLTGNIRQDLALDLVGESGQFYALRADENHGTAVAGIIAARKNLIGGIGIAYQSHLLPIRYLGKRQSESTLAEALGHQRRITSISNNSWGPSIDGSQSQIAFLGPGTLGKMALHSGITEGRAGRGMTYVFSAGNSAISGSRADYNGWASARETIAVGALGNRGIASAYSEPGSCVMVCAPSSGQSLGIYTTDRSGLQGYQTGDYTPTFSGTSAAAPMVSAVVALMLEANPLLGWRDVQHILIHTAVQSAADDPGWERNAADLYFHEKMGFGRIDANAAVQCARNWRQLPPEHHITQPLTVTQTIPDDGISSLTSTIKVETPLKLEHVLLSLQCDHEDWGDLHLTLIAPSGTRSTFITPHSNAIKRYAKAEFMSLRSWGEEAKGTWTLEILDQGTGGVGSLNQWTIDLYGTVPDTHDNRPPSANPDQVISTVYPVVFRVTDNDLDEDGDPILITSLYQGEWGDVTLESDQQLRYMPGPDFHGIDRIGYTVLDPQGGSSDTLVQILHPGPVANPDQAVVFEGGNVDINLLSNDFDRSGDPLKLIALGATKNGDTSMIDEHQIRYQALRDGSSRETFDYLVSDGTSEDRGEVVVFVSSNRDHALGFDGVDDHAITQPHPSLHMVDAFTLEASFYLKTFGENGESGFGRILDHGNFSLFTNGAGHDRYPDQCLVLAMEMPDGSTVTAHSPENSILLNRWNQVAVTYDGKLVQILINGKITAVWHPYGDPSGPLMAKPQNPLWIGEAESGERAFHGLMSWIRIWNRARPAGELTRAKETLPPEESFGLAAWWRFDEGTGSTAHDQNAGAISLKVDGPQWCPTDPNLIASALESIESSRVLKP